MSDFQQFVSQFSQYWDNTVFKKGLLNKLPRKLTHKFMSFKKSDLKRWVSGVRKI